MKITPITHALDLAAGGPSRSPGLHMSDIYGAYYRAADPKKFDKRDATGARKPFDTVKMELGLVFEEILEPLLAARLFGKRPKEQATVVDGVDLFYSPDYIFFINDELVLGEFKCTWYSSKGAPRGPKFRNWISQIKLYCHCLNINVARLFVLFVNGDYKPPTPKLLCWELRFTDEETAEEWEIMMRFAREEGLLHGTIKDVR